MPITVLPDTVLPILLAGGMGTRLSPITADLPKPLVPIDGTPVLCRTLVTLASLGVRRAVVTVRYRADDIIGLLGDEYAGIRLFYSREDAAPLGTAGGVRAAWERYAHETDTDALVISGDAVFTCDLAAFAAHHAQKRAAASLLCMTAADPCAFGIVHTDPDGRITGFSEKPCVAEAVTDTVNAGIYMLSRTLLRTVPDNTPSDFGQDIFPAALRRGEALYGYRGEGFWCDIGSFSSYLACSLDVSAGRIPGMTLPVLHPKLPPHISDCSVGVDCFVPASASVRRSILFDRVVIGAGASVSGSILCADVRIGDNAIVEPGCVLGRGAVIGDGVHLVHGTRVMPGEVISDSPRPAHTAPAAADAFGDGALSAPYLRDIGYALSHDSSPQPELVLAFARALVAYAAGRGCGLFLCRTADTAPLLHTQRLLCDALACLSPTSDAETEVVSADGVLVLSAARMPFLPLPIKHGAGEVLRVVLGDWDGILTAAVFDAVGLYPTRSEERQLDACFADALAAMTRPRPDTKPSPVHRPIRITQVSAQALEEAYLRACAHPPLPAPDGDAFSFRCGVSPADRLLARLLTRMGGRESPAAPLLFSVSGDTDTADGILTPLTVTDTREGGKTYTHWQLVSMLAAHADSTAPFPTPRVPAPEKSRPAPLSVPVCAPPEVPAVMRYAHSPMLSSDADTAAARHAAAIEAEDGILLARSAAHLFAAAQSDRTRESLPPLCRRCGYVLSDGMTSAGGPAASLRTLTEVHSSAAFVPAGEGILCRTPDGGSVRIVATRQNSFRVIADAYSAEAADTLFRFAREQLLCAVTSGAAAKHTAT